MTERAVLPLSFAHIAAITLIALAAGCSDSTKPTPYSPAPTASGGGGEPPPTGGVVLSVVSATPALGSTLQAHSNGSITATVKYDLGASMAAHYEFLVMGVGPGGSGLTDMNYLEAWTGGAPPYHDGTMNLSLPCLNLPANSTIYFYVYLVGNSGTAQVRLNYTTGS